MVREASESVNVTPAQYDWVEERVLVKQASSKIVEVPAVYASKSETIKVRDAQIVWRTGLSSEDAPASRELLANAKEHGIRLDDAKPGACFHEHYRPAQYQITPQQVEIAAASYRIETVPAEYRWVEKRVLVKDASTEIREIPAQYVTETETVVDVPAHTVWKKGSGPIQKIDEATGEIMCLVDVPATYKTISKRILKSPARSEVIEIPAEYKTIKVKELVSAAQEKRVEIPAQYSSVDVTKQVADAEFVWHDIHDTSHPANTRTGAKICLTETPAQYKTVKRQVVVTPASSRTVELPAEYETVKVKKLVRKASESREVIPAEYKTVTLKQVDKDGRMEWRSILCKTNTTPDLIKQLQTVLQDKGYNPGPIDGYVGSATINAVNSYQADNQLPIDKYLNIKTLKHLKVL
ncbi:MAG: peptidoglycan-binding protein [Gammaproteobacteria bacterium]|nr:peptidoglycan-binding protein [Gammaproteobacteria bacterium]NHN35686.1 peptidoglycan-binding protein [Pseudomaricurvus alcaniphilus]